MKTPISYYGGKQRIASKIVKYFPNHTVYVEPFCGGAAVFFTKPLPMITNSTHYREVLNDKNELLVNFFRVLRSDDGEELIRHLKLTPYSKAEHKKAVEICKNPNGASDLEKAWAYYVNINQSFAKIENGGWGFGLFTQNHCVTWSNGNNRLKSPLDRLQSVYIECDDAINIIKKWDSPQTLFYCDPPYIGTDQNYEFKIDDSYYKNLILALNNAEGSFVLSGYDNNYVPDEWFTIRFEVKIFASKIKEVSIDKERTECIWIVDRSENVRPEIKKIFNTQGFDCFGRYKFEKAKVINETY
jgi:DNA adenine methylase